MYIFQWTFQEVELGYQALVWLPATDTVPSVYVNVVKEGKSLQSILNNLVFIFYSQV